MQMRIDAVEYEVGKNGSEEKKMSSGYREKRKRFFRGSRERERGERIGEKKKKKEEETNVGGRKERCVNRFALKLKGWSRGALVVAVRTVGRVKEGGAYKEDEASRGIRGNALHRKAGAPVLHPSAVLRCTLPCASPMRWRTCDDVTRCDAQTRRSTMTEGRLFLLVVTRHAPQKKYRIREFNHR